MNREEFLSLVCLYKNNPDNVKKEKILKLAVENPLWLVLPESDKGIWETCAQLLVELPYQAIKSIFPDILMWYQDVNWPGVDVITEYFTKVPCDDLKQAVSDCFTRAEDDDFWLFGLVWLLERTKLIDSFNKTGKYKELIIKSEYFNQ